MEDFLDFVAGIMGVNPEELSGETAYGEYEKWDSLTHIQLVMSVEEKYGVEIPLVEVAEIKTLADLYKYTEA